MKYQATTIPLNQHRKPIDWTTQVTHVVNLRRLGSLKKISIGLSNQWCRQPGNSFSVQAVFTLNFPKEY